MFQKIFKNYEAKNLANTWQQSLRNREIAKNSYKTHGDLKKAKAFVTMVSNYSFAPEYEASEEQIIFSSDTAFVPAFTV